MKLAPPRWRIALYAIAVAVVAAIFFFPDEPSVDGHSLSTWLHFGICHQPWYRDEAPSDLPPLPEVESALRRLGPKAIPILLTKLDATDPAWLCSLSDWLREQSWAPSWADINGQRAWQDHEEAVFGFSVLKTQAVAAIPELAVRLSQTNASVAAAFCLAAMGEPAIPALRAAWNDPRLPDRRYLAYALERHPTVLKELLPEIRASKLDPNDRMAAAAHSLLIRHAETNEATAVLHEALRDGREAVVLSGLLHLARSGSNSVPFIPDLAALLTHSNRFIRSKATNVLHRLDPAAAFAAGVNTNPPARNTNAPRSGRGRR